jgi:hypothetical protein
MLMAAGGASLMLLPAQATAQSFNIGDVVSCDGSQGPIIRKDPRPGWDEPFYIVRVPDGGTSGEFKCLPARMRRVSAAAAPAVRSRPAAPARGSGSGAGATGGAAARAPDGTYDCHKIMGGGGQLIAIGTLTIRGGRATLAGLPSGWTVRSVSALGRDSRGRQLVAYDYRSGSGFNDRLDCVAR